MSTRPRSEFSAGGVRGTIASSARGRLCAVIFNSVRLSFLTVEFRGNHSPPGADFQLKPPFVQNARCSVVQILAVGRVYKPTQAIEISGPSHFRTIQDRPKDRPVPPC